MAAAGAPGRRAAGPGPEDAGTEAGRPGQADPHHQHPDRTGEEGAGQRPGTGAAAGPPDRRPRGAGAHLRQRTAPAGTPDRRGPGQGAAPGGGPCPAEGGVRPHAALCLPQPQFLRPAQLHLRLGVLHPGLPPLALPGPDRHPPPAPGRTDRGHPRHAGGHHRRAQGAAGRKGRATRRAGGRTQPPGRRPPGAPDRAERPAQGGGPPEGPAEEAGEAAERAGRRHPPHHRGGGAPQQGQQQGHLHPDA